MSKKPATPTVQDLQRRLDKLTPVMQKMRGLKKDLLQMAKETQCATLAHGLANIAAILHLLANETIEIRSGEGSIEELRKEGHDV